MTPEQKQSALNRHRTVMLATLDYLIESFGGSFVYDQLDPVTEYYQQQKIQTERYYKQRRLDRLQQRLAGLTKTLQSRADLGFANYIKERTGYDIDIFEDLRMRVDAIIAQKEIRKQKELNDVGLMLQFYHKSSADKEAINKLNKLCTDYSKQTHELAISAASRKKKGRYSEVVSSIQKDGVGKVTIRVSTGQKPKHLEEQEAVSPDGKRRLRMIQWSDGKHASTCVLILCPAAGGAVYGTNGIHPDIKASWKDNSTIVIKTKKDYIADLHCKEVRSFDDVITIEYIEN